MKTRKSSWAILGIVVLLGIGYLIPTMVMQLNDWSLNNTQKDVEIEAIQLETGNLDLLEALQSFSKMISNNIIVEAGTGFSMSYDEAMKQTKGDVSEELYTSVQEFLTILDVKEEAVLEEFYAQNYVMLVDEKDETMYSVWVCEGTDRSGKTYVFWVDATLNKVMAFDVPFAIFGNGEEAFFTGMERVIQYYEFSSYESLLYSYSSDMSELLKAKKYWQNEVEILDKNLDIILTLKFGQNENRFWFNTESGIKNISYYDAEQTK
ncbi:MAG: hypothetical protein IJO60_03030 [Agathobacter sp.]|nr:hypothetical protein [Agathobacter sp.]